ncbi:MarR family transcriptional regulator [Candidatus Saccharibacteria bacterium]|nr:MarR family transcriptional regulator [Candidatus Saccharibacteria bacterium]
MNTTNNLGYLMQHVAAVMARQADQVLQDKLNIGLSQFKILMILQKHPGVQQRFIADGLGQTEASVTRQIKLLHEVKLVTSKPDPTDRRQHIATPTILGKKTATDAMKLIRDTFGPEYESMGRECFQQLIDGLNALHGVVCQEGKTSNCGHVMDTASADTIPAALRSRA